MDPLSSLLPRELEGPDCTLDTPMRMGGMSSGADAIPRGSGRARARNMSRAKPAGQADRQTNPPSLWRVCVRERKRMSASRAGRKSRFPSHQPTPFSYRREFRKLEPRSHRESLGCTHLPLPPQIEMAGDPLECSGSRPRCLINLASSFPRMDKPLRHD